MARRLLTSDDLIAMKNGLWQSDICLSLSSLASSGDTAYSEICDLVSQNDDDNVLHWRRRFPSWSFLEDFAAVLQLWLQLATVSMWHAIKHSTPFTHSPQFVRCSQWEVSNNLLWLLIHLFAVTLVPVFVVYTSHGQPRISYTILHHNHLCVKMWDNLFPGQRYNCGPS